jgi:hypothetical protein
LSIGLKIISSGIVVIVQLSGFNSLFTYNSRSLAHFYGALPIVGESVLSRAVYMGICTKNRTSAENEENQTFSLIKIAKMNLKNQLLLFILDYINYKIINK